MVAAPISSSISDFLDDPAVPDLDVKDPIPPPTLDDNQQYFVRCGRCNAAYTLTQDMIKPEGSRVKCEVCGHTWFQAANRLQVLGEGYVLKVRNSQRGGTKEAVSVHLGVQVPYNQCAGPEQDYPDDLKEKVLDNVKNGRHPMDTSAQKGAISCFIGNLPFSVSEG